MRDAESTTKDYRGYATTPAIVDNGASTKLRFVNGRGTRVAGRGRPGSNSSPSQRRNFSLNDKNRDGARGSVVGAFMKMNRF
ncbi:hypothetical protein EVAR_85680_1 [Eumeta japonica]|uniref:Uncharacterized protein n=1 Tax=Eumeta variegata TaxID=151549 RepID=A0A4C1WD64_EUMVA|nr:hypothetical protein EVAR_85680_1 [Eumeta japonica]